MSERRVVFVAFDRMQLLDLAGPLEVFAGAARTPGTGHAYSIEVASLGGGPTVTTSSGVSVGAPVALEHIVGRVDTLVVVGGVGSGAAAADPRLVAEVGRLAQVARRVCSVCTGAFVLASAGLLDGRSATTHWASCDELASRYPDVEVLEDPIFVRDDNVWTSAGVTAGIDLALALVEEDFGPAVARLVARWLVMYLQRPGGQNQFSAPLAAQATGRPALRELQAWIREHIGEDCSVPALARRAGMSERTLTRAFRQECGTTPAEYVEQIRIEAARQVLESTELTIAAIADRSGFGTPETMHRAFRRRLGVTPGAYRSRFHAAPA